MTQHPSQTSIALIVASLLAAAPAHADDHVRTLTVPGGHMMTITGTNDPACPGADPLLVLSCVNEEFLMMIDTSCHMPPMSRVTVTAELSRTTQGSEWPFFTDTSGTDLVPAFTETHWMIATLLLVQDSELHFADLAGEIRSIRFAPEGWRPVAAELGIGCGLVLG